MHLLMMHAHTNMHHNAHMHTCRNACTYAGMHTCTQECTHAHRNAHSTCTVMQNYLGVTVLLLLILASCIKVRRKQLLWTFGGWYGRSVHRVLSWWSILWKTLTPCVNGTGHQERKCHRHLDLFKFPYSMK